MVWAALTSVQLVNKVPVTIRVLSVCSTLRTLKPTALRLLTSATSHLVNPSNDAASGGAAAEGSASQMSVEQKFLQAAREELLDCVTTS